MAYAGLNTVGLLWGSAAVFYFAWSAGMTQLLLSLIGFFLGVVFAPILHELGHLIFAAAHGLKYVYFKAFCFRFVRASGRVRFSIVSPFGADETQVIPTRGGNMRKRAGYFAGKLFFAKVSMIKAPGKNSFPGKKQKCFSITSLQGYTVRWSTESGTICRPWQKRKQGN